MVLIHNNKQTGQGSSQRKTQGPHRQKEATIPEDDP